MGKKFQAQNHFILIASAMLVLSSPLAYAQFGGESAFSQEDDEFEVGGDIFSDFSEDVEQSHIMEDERFYRYGRFFSFQLGLGTTTFTGNRGLAYEDQDPSFNFGVSYFINFRNAVTMGIEYSQHSMFVDYKTILNDTNALGNIQVRMLRSFFGYRYYFDTSDLGTAITWSNPYLTCRMEYWYQKNKFMDVDNIESLTGGGIGTSFGGGLEFPVQIKESYIGLEGLYHSVNFFDKYTADYQSSDGNQGGYEDLSGGVISVMVSYVLSW